MLKLIKFHLYLFIRGTIFIFCNCIFLCRIDPIIAVVDWTLAASKFQSPPSSRSGKLFIMKPLTICSPLAFVYGVPAVNTWPVGRHMALLHKLINDTIEEREWILCILCASENNKFILESVVQYTEGWGNFKWFFK